MLLNCANRACSAPFVYGQGRIFRFHQSHSKGKKGKDSHAVRHFWLCTKCAEKYSLEYRKGRVELIPRRLIVVFSGESAPIG
jgi:hypothetical protein